MTWQNGFSVPKSRKMPLKMRTAGCVLAQGLSDAQNAHPLHPGEVDGRGIGFLGFGKGRAKLLDAVGRSEKERGRQREKRQFLYWRRLIKNVIVYFQLNIYPIWIVKDVYIRIRFQR